MFQLGGKVVIRGGEIEIVRAIDLNIDEARGQDLPLKIDGLVGSQVRGIKGGLRTDDATSIGGDPKITLQQLPMLEEPGIGELDHTRLRNSHL